MLDVQSSAYTMFAFGIRSSLTRRYYERRLRTFFNYIELEGTTIEERCNIFSKKGRENSSWALTCVVKFLQFEKERVERKEITAAPLKNFVKAIKLFCEMSDIDVPWKKMTRGFPKVRRYADDRAPTLDEINKIIEYPDRRIKAIVYTMVSSGIRLGAWDYLRWGDIKPIWNENKLVAARMKVYAGDDEQYVTFLSPEAYNELSKWMDYRQKCGEEIDENSWVMRNIWNTKMGHTHGFITIPRRLKSSGIKRLMEDALWTQGIRKNLTGGKKRHEFQADHGFRKWFKTRTEMSGMKSINIETLMGHSLGISDSYYRATEQDLLEDYLRAVDYLTINNESKMRAKILVLENEISNGVNSREKDERIERLERKLDSLQSKLESIVNSLSMASENDRNILAKHLFRNNILLMGQS